MAPRSGQLDEISEAIGRLSGQVESLDRYTHEREHNIANLAQKVEGIGALVANAKAEINASMTTAIERVEARIHTIDERVTILERIKERETGARGIIAWLLQSPLVGWLVAAILFVAAWWKDQAR
jgi:archaellum component FlaC